MTVIAYRAGVLACDSRITHDSEAGGTRTSKCVKMFRKPGAIVALAGETSPGLVFLDWYGSGKEPPGILIDGEADFLAMVLTNGGLFEFDKWCRGEPVKLHRGYWAQGCGAKVALGAMYQGATAVQAVAAACAWDPYCGTPIVSMELVE